MDIIKLIENIFKEKVYDYDFCIKQKEKDYPKYLKKIYKQHTNKSLNLKHPKTFGEKIQYLKLYDNLPIKAQLTDKIEVIKWISDKIDKKHIKKIYAIYNDIDEIDLEQLPQKFALKMSHASRMNYFCKDRAIFIKDKDVNIRQIKEWESCNFAFACGFELQYKNIPPRIIIEEYITWDEDGNREEKRNNFAPNSIEFYCFNGKIRLICCKEIQKITRFGYTIYDENLNPLDYTFSKPNRYFLLKNIELPKTNHLNKMIEYAQKLSEQFKFVRVDFMFTDLNFWFEEMTFTPNSGFYNIPDKNFEKMLSDWLII